MSNSTEFWLELKLKKEHRGMVLDVNKALATKDFEVLVKIINKASKIDVDLSPLAKFLKDDLLTKMYKDDWKITDAKFVVKEYELLQYYKDKKAKGGTSTLASEEQWPWVDVSNINDFLLMFDGHLTTTRYVEGSPNGGYVHKSYYKRNQEIAEKLKSKSSKSSWKNFAPDEKGNKEVPKEAPKFNLVILTKVEGKICRKKIIVAATKSDICSTGFKPEFMEGLDDSCKSYLHNCSDLQVKLMRAEVEKK